MNHRPDPDRTPVTRVEDPAGYEPAQQESDVREEVRATVGALLPWGVSILAHAALIILAFFLVWQTIDNSKDEPHEVSVTFTEAPTMSPLPKNLVEDDQKDPAGGAITVPDIKPVDPVKPTTVGFTLPSDAVLLDQISKIPSDGIGDKPGPGDGPGGPLSIEPPQWAKRIVYVIDASGSMVDVLPFVVNELKRVTQELNANQEVTIIFFSGKGVAEVPGGGQAKGLRPMTAQFKEQLRQWVSLENHNIDVGGRGSAFVEQALIRGLSYKPQLMFLLSDNLTGGGQGATRHELMQEDLIKSIQEHNKARPATMIHTIQFLYQDPLVRAGLKPTLERIADETGGKYRFINDEELKFR